MDIQKLLLEAQEGFKTLSVGEKHQLQALKFLEEWLSDPQYSDYTVQIQHLIENNHWDYLLDSFYQVIPFGTGGRRGEVGVGPNRINPWTIKASCQGHSQYLIKQYGEEVARDRGVVISFDVREFFGNHYLSNEIDNPVKNLTCKDLAEECVRVYAANGLKCYLFDGFRSTPELSFAIRHLQALGGSMISASHNPPEHNGQKVFDEFGGQLIPPEDQNLVKEVAAMEGIREISLDDARDQGLLQIIGQEIDDAYRDILKTLPLTDARDIKIVYTPLHGTGLTNLYMGLTSVGFQVEKDPKTSYPSGKFENVTFNIPNPEVEQSFETSLAYAKEVDADILLSSDPDSDRFGAMVKHKGEWVFLNGNEIAVILTEHLIAKKPELKGRGVLIKTAVTTDLMRQMAEKNDLQMIGDLLVGYKYVGEEMNKLEKEGRVDDVLLSCEESHGYLIGTYARDKDSAAPAIIFAELAAELKQEGKTIIDHLRGVYAKYGYFRNYLTEIRLPGAEGRAQIDQIQAELRKNPPMEFGRFKVSKFEDYLDRTPIVSETDEASKNVIALHCEPVSGTLAIKVTIRPSGTEPKIKMYYEIGSEPFEESRYTEVRAEIENIRKELEKDFMKVCYKLIGVDFPDRGFLLFWQLPLQSKLKYFEIEPEIIRLKDVGDRAEREQKLMEMFNFLGSNPIEKVDEAFSAEHQVGIREYLSL